MTRILLTALLILGAALPPPASAQSAQSRADQYKIGDRLEAPKGAASASKAKSRYRELKWDDLISPEWNPEAFIKSLNLDTMLDTDSRAIAAMEQLRQEWNNAPANQALDNTEVRLPGFVVPLEREGTALKEFLLVPYFGACIHVPPPPANQIVHVIASKPIPDAATMDAVWVSGKLTLDGVQTHMGRSAYRLKAEKVEAYAKKP
jgi:hypothetical protein